MSVRFEDLSVGQELPVSERVLSREDVEAYAQASGDLNPLHRKDEVARAAGLPGIVAHGMLTMGTLASALVEWLGDPRALTRLKVQFRAPVFLGETIQSGGMVRSLDPRSRTAVLEVWVRVERGGRTEWPIRRSEAEIRLA
ncbi:MAG TPA: MaoC/PaaZ C-terminal domain-containing protein [Actinomycetota bacterium]|nr:MaoC/PaaZ C-terminal domain-containing protein [Actinomycetota bacterium]